MPNTDEMAREREFLIHHSIQLERNKLGFQTPPQKPESGIDPSKDKLTVSERLRELADLYEQKNKEYGDAYKNVGIVFDGLGLKLSLNGSWVEPSRVAILSVMVYKLQRYAHAIHTGGHGDSLDDLAVYAMMLREIDDDQR